MCGNVARPRLGDANPLGRHPGAVAGQSPVHLARGRRALAASEPVRQRSDYMNPTGGRLRAPSTRTASAGVTCTGTPPESRARRWRLAGPRLPSRCGPLRSRHGRRGAVVAGVEVLRRPTVGAITFGFIAEGQRAGGAVRLRSQMSGIWSRSAIRQSSHDVLQHRRQAGHVQLSAVAEPRAGGRGTAEAASPRVG